MNIVMITKNVFLISPASPQHIKLSKLNGNNFTDSFMSSISVRIFETNFESHTIGIQSNKNELQIGKFDILFFKS